MDNKIISKSEAPLLITIVTATYNAEKYLPQLANSIREQTYTHIEWIVVDGGSDDKTLDILRQNEDVITYWASEPDKGIYDAWNKGIQHAHGDWIHFLGADDFLWNKEVMACMASDLKIISKQTQIAYAQIMLVNEASQHICLAGEPWEKIKGRFMHIMCMPHQGVFHRRSLFEKYGNFDDSFRIAGDYEFLLRELKTAEADFVPVIVTGMRQGGISSNPKNAVIALREIRRAQKKHGFRWPGKIWTFAYIRSYIRSWMWQILGERYVRYILDMYRRLLGLPPYWTKL